MTWGVIQSIFRSSCNIESARLIYLASKLLYRGMAAALAACHPEGPTVISILKSQLASTEKAISDLSGVALGQGYVVSCGGVYLTFGGGSNLASDPRPCAGPQYATRFNRADSLAVAAGVRNAQGEAGRAIGLVAALEAKRAELASILARIQ